MQINAKLSEDYGPSAAAGSARHDSFMGQMIAEAQFLEEAGYQGVSTSELSHGPFIPLALAAGGTRKVELWTAIAVAFGRTPMTIAQAAHELQSFSKGRFVLGLGSQVEAHVKYRYSMPWSKPAARMKEMIQAIHAIWDCWYEGKKLDFRGEFYTHTLMPPRFTPIDPKHGKPRIVVAAVGPKMTEISAEVADGVICHSFTTGRYLREVTLPAIQRALTAANRPRSTFQVVVPFFIVTGATAEDMAKTKAEVKKHIAFYGSTPAYRPILDLHGWGDLQTELYRLTKEGRWNDMGAVIDDSVLDAFAVVAEPKDLAASIRKRYEGVADVLSIKLGTGDRDILARLGRELGAS